MTNDGRRHRPVAGLPFSWARASIAAAATALVIGIPTDILANPVFGREIPVRWWEYPVFGLTVLLTAAWFGIQARPTDRSSGAVPATGAVLAFLAVGCPVCNKLVLLAIGTSGALGFWAPLQPVVAIVSVVLMAGAVVYRWRRRDCGDACGQCDSGAAEGASSSAAPNARSTAESQA